MAFYKSMATDHWKIRNAGFRKIPRSNGYIFMKVLHQLAIMYFKILEYAHIPISVERIGSRAFSGCTSLTNITIRNNYSTLITYPFFQQTVSNTELILENNISNLSIGSYCFEMCTNLKYIVLPERIKEIGGYTFCGCTSLTKVIIECPLPNISSFMFSECSSLKDINMPSNLKYIMNNAFEHCNSLVSLTIPDKVVDIQYSAFQCCCSLETVKFGGNLVFIERSAFYNCTSLTNITLPYSITTIGMNAFTSCNSLKEIFIPYSVQTLNANAFLSCKNLKSVVIGDPENLSSLTKVSSQSFGDNPNLVSLTYYGMNNPGNLSAFTGTTNLKTVNVMCEYNSTQFCGIKVKNLCVFTQYFNNDILFTDLMLLLLFSLLLL